MLFWQVYEPKNYIFAVQNSILKETKNGRDYSM